MDDLTLREREVLEYISLIKNKDGYPPSVRDIQSGLGFKSTSSVHAALTKLVEKGYIKKVKSKSRSLVLSDARGISDDGVLSVPVLGVVRAGAPILAAENHMFYISFPKREGSNVYGELFGLKVRGESMIGAGIMDSDIVIVRKEDTAQDGDIVVALIDSEATVKRYFSLGDGKVKLQPENPDMEPIITDDVTLLGKVVSVVRYYP